MTYTKSAAQIGRGTLLAIGSGGGSETFTTVAECKSMKLSGRKFDTEDTTNLQSASREFVATIRDEGEWDIAGNRVSADAGQIAMEAAYQAGALTDFTITLPKTGAQVTTGDKYAFAALITELVYGIDVTKATDFQAKLKVSGAMVLTPGA